ncbi:hypothetical protein [Streptomyces gardneri]
MAELVVVAYEGREGIDLRWPAQHRLEPHIQAVPAKPAPADTA